MGLGGWLYEKLDESLRGWVSLREVEILRGRLQ